MLEKKKKKKLSATYDADGNQLTVVIAGKEIPFDKKFKENQASKQKHFIDNKEMLAEVIKSKADGVITDRLCIIFKTLVERLKYSSQGNFAGYTYLPDMQSEAFVHLVTHAWTKFDETKYDNPFGFFSMVTTNCFKSILKKEKRQREIRDALLCRAGSAASMRYEEEHGSYGDRSWMEDEKFYSVDYSVPAAGMIDLNEDNV
jgi:hypothetical protein